MTEMPGEPQTFRPHPQRAAILGEIHARPFRPVSGARAFLMYAFEVPAGDAARAEVASAASSRVPSRQERRRGC